MEAASFAIHHELLGAIEVNVVPALGIIFVDRVSDQLKHFGLANSENGGIPLTELSMYFVWLEEEEGPTVIVGIFLALGCASGSCRATILSLHGYF